MDWFEEAKAKREKDPNYGYGRIAKDYGIPYNTVKSRFQRYRKNNEDDISLTTPAEPDNTAKAKLLKLLETDTPMNKLCDSLGLPDVVVHYIIGELRTEGYFITELGDNFKLQKDYIKQTNMHKLSWNGDKIIKFGVVSDNHLGSIYQQLTFLHSLYDIFAIEGVSLVLNAGDLTEGWKMRSGHEFDCHKHAYGITSQIEYVIANYPKRNGITTKFILGNHDLSGLKSSGIIIGDLIAQRREDMQYLGMLNAKIEITPKCVIELNHPLDGASFALSYSLQKYIDSLSGGDKPSILFNGHHHKLFNMMYRNIFAVECGTTQAQSSWMRGKRIAANVGGIIVTVHVNDNGEVTRFIPEFIPCYKIIPNDF